MAGDTIVVNSRLEEGPRLKRLKTGQAKAGDNTTIRFPLAYSLQGTRGATRQRNLKVNVMDTPPKEANGDLDPQTSASVRAARAVIADAVSVETTPSPPQTPKPVSPRHTPSRVLRSDTKAINESHAPDINLSAAPTDPIELTWWVAQHLTHFQNTTSLDVDIDSRKCNQTPSIRTLRKLPDSPPHDMEQRHVSERDRVREDNRERKKRWRADNKERSESFYPSPQELDRKRLKHRILDKDNDLRCRVNKLAKTKFGVENTVEKAKFVENEFNKRRTKREAKQRKRATQSRQFPHIFLPPELRATLLATLFPQQQQQRGLIPKQLNVVGSLLINLLFANDKNGDFGSKEKAANAVNLALTKSTFKDSIVIEALRTIAGNRDLMKGINNALENDHEEIDEETNGLSEDDHHESRLQPAETQAETTQDDASITIEQSNEMIKALNAALALMNEMADTTAKTYASPYGNLPPSTPSASLSTNKINEKNRPPVAGTLSSLINREQIDALLALANGGPLTDDEDDNTIADGDDLEEQRLDLSNEPGTDSDVCKTIEEVIDQLVKDRSKVEDSGYRQNPLDPFGPQSAQEQASRLREHFSQAGIRKNIIIPTAHGQTLSQLYSYLNSRTRPSPPPDQLKPGPSSVYVGPQQPLPAPPLSAVPTVSSSSQTSPPPTTPALQGQNPPFTLSATPNPPQGQTIPFPSRATPSLTGSRTEEEQQKIRSYGFPPLPGTRIGTPRK